MVTYCFHCSSESHPADLSRDFQEVIHLMSNPKKKIDQFRCKCGATAKRDLSKEIPSQAIIGVTPIRPGGPKDSIGNEISYAFGKFKKNPDGTEDKNHAPFADTGELNKFMNGQNNLGAPVIKDDGTPLRSRDGAMVRQGAKLFKYGKNAAPSKDGVRRERPRVPDGWVGEKDVLGTSGGLRKI